MGDRTAGVTAGGHSAHHNQQASAFARLRIFAEFGIFGLVPLLILLPRIGLDAYHLVDFQYLWHAARDVAAGVSPYHPPSDPSLAVTADCVLFAKDCYVYPPVTAAMAVPLGLLAWSLAGSIYLMIEVVSILLALRLVGVSDWRCYGVALASPPVFEGIEGGTLTPVLVLGVAALWKYRDKRSVAIPLLAALVVTKLFLWPLLVWALATRRATTALVAAAAGAVMTVASWSIIGFAGLTEYPERVAAVMDVWQARAYTPLALGLGVGFPLGAAKAVQYAVGAGLLAAAVFVARRNSNDRDSLTLGLAAALVLSPTTWLHSFSLLLVPLGLAFPRLHAAWAWPLAFNLFAPALGPVAMLRERLTVPVGLALAAIAPIPVMTDGKLPLLVALVLAVAAAFCLTLLRPILPPVGVVDRLPTVQRRVHLVRE